MFVKRVFSSMHRLEVPKAQIAWQVYIYCVYIYINIYGALNGPWQLIPSGRLNILSCSD